jgi:transcriptional regulator with XRE-family HTH domain
MKSSLAKTLGSLRRERKLSQREAATKLGVSQALLSHYENDAREPKFDFVIRACDYYGVSADYLLGRSDERNGVSIRVFESVRDVVDELIGLKTSETNLFSKLEQLTNGRT